MELIKNILVIKQIDVLLVFFIKLFLFLITTRALENIEIKIILAWIFKQILF